MTEKEEIEKRLNEMLVAAKQDEEKLMKILENRRLERRKLLEKKPEVKSKSFIQRIISFFN